jgi:hypothetical protein
METIRKPRRFRPHYWLKAHGMHTRTMKPLKTKGKGKAEATGVNVAIASQSPFVPPENPAHASPKERTPKYTTSELAQLKSCYLVKGMDRREIAAKLGWTPDRVSQVISRHGLTAQREQIQIKTEQLALNKAVDEVSEQLNRWSPQAAELADDLLDAARSELKGNSDFKAKNVAAYASAFKTYSSCYQVFNGVNGLQKGNSAITINMLYTPLEEAKPAPKSAEPAVDV